MRVKTLISNLNKELSGPLEFIPEIFLDKRGYFLETWNEDKLNLILRKKTYFVQDNESMSKKNVLRGLHYQLPPFSQDKLLRAIKGSIYDVIVDLRKDSQTFLEWTSLEICSKIKNQLWIPKGFAHGFLTLSDTATIQYKTTNFWSKDHERTLFWNDKDIKIDWSRGSSQNQDFLISEKDLNGETYQSLYKSSSLF